MYDTYLEEEHLWDMLNFFAFITETDELQDKEECLFHIHNALERYRDESESRSENKKILKFIEDNWDEFERRTRNAVDFNLQSKYAM